MKSVLASIKPEYCKLIASGQKTVEIRKTRPKIDTLFRCYIYETMASYAVWHKGAKHLTKFAFCGIIKEIKKEGMSNVSKYFYYVGVRTSDGLALVTSVNNIDRFAFWDVNEKPLAMSRAMANDYAERLCMNSFTAVVIKSFFELNKHFVPDEKKYADI